MKRFYNILALLFSSVFVAGFFQNCDSGFQNAHFDIASNSNALSLDVGELQNTLQHFTSEESIPIEDFSLEEQELIKSGSASLQLDKLYVGKKHIVFFGSCDPRYGSMVELEIEGVSDADFMSWGKCFNYQGSNENYLGENVAIGIALVKLTQAEYSMAMRYHRGALEIPGGMHSNKRDLHEHIRSLTKNQIPEEIVDKAYTKTLGQGSRFDFSLFEQTYKSIKASLETDPEPYLRPSSQITHPVAGQMVSGLTVVEGTCSNDPQILIQPGGILTPCVNNQFRKLVDFSSVSKDGFEIHAKAPSVYSYPADDIGSSVWVVRATDQSDDQTDQTDDQTDQADDQSDQTDETEEPVKICQSGTIQLVEKIYDRRFNRYPDTDGMEFWCKEFKRHNDPTRLEVDIIMGVSGARDISYIKNDETRKISAIDFAVENGNVMPMALLTSSESSVVGVFKKWLGRLPKGGGLIWWGSKYDEGNMNINQLNCHIVTGAQEPDHHYVKTHKKQAFLQLCAPLGFSTPAWLN